MEEQFGGPVWHASGSTLEGNTRDGRRLARAGLAGVGDATLGEWTFDGERAGVVHVIRRLSDDERAEFAVPAPYDIRGTREENARIAAVYDESPHLIGIMP